MTDDQIFTKTLYAEIKRLSRVYKVKYAPRFHGIFHVNEDHIWRARVVPGFLLSDNSFDVQLIVSVGATCFDYLLASIINPEENVRVTELNHGAGVYVGPSMQVVEKTYKFQFGNNVSPDEMAYEAASMIVREAMESVSGFINQVMNRYTDMVSYMLSLKESNPMECGLAYLSKAEYQFAYACFKYAADHSKFWHISYGPKARMLHLILIDYCNAMQNGIDWKYEYVINGLCNE